MEQLPGYEESDLQKYCVKLYKLLYGLKQAGFKWYKIICCMLADLGFKKWEADPAIFYIHTSKNILILAIHVNDCTITGSSDDLIQSYKLKIKSKYDLMDLRPIHWLLGIKITQDHENCTISLSQSSYINSPLRQFNFTDLRPFSTPMNPNIWYPKNQCPQTLSLSRVPTLVIQMLPTSTMPTGSSAYRVRGFPKRHFIIILRKRRGSDIFGPPNKVDVRLLVGEACTSVFLIRKVRWLEDGRF